MPLTDAEAQKCWPVYEQYNAEKVKIKDDKLLVIKDYAANFEKLSDNQAQTLVNSGRRPTSQQFNFEQNTSQCSKTCCPAKRQPCFSSWIAEFPFC